jgi:hypothetical protein
VSYDLELSLLDPGGSMDGALVVELIVRRAGLSEVDLDAIGLEILEITERRAPRRFALDGGHLRIVLEPPAAEGGARARDSISRAVGRAEAPRRSRHTAYHTREWMPQLRPRRQGTFDLSLVVPKGWTIPASGSPLTRSP